MSGKSDRTFNKANVNSSGKFYMGDSNGTKSEDDALTQMVCFFFLSDLFVSPNILLI